MKKRILTLLLGLALLAGLTVPALAAGVTVRCVSPADDLGIVQVYGEAPMVTFEVAKAEGALHHGQGRILIPNHLRQRAKLEKEVVVAGIFNRVEIWNAQRWAELEEEAFSSGSLEQAMEEMGL